MIIVLYITLFQISLTLELILVVISFVLHFV